MPAPLRMAAAPARQYGMDLAADVFRLLFNLYNWHEYLQNVPYKGGGDSWKVLKHQLIKFARDQTSFHALKSAKPNAKGSASRKRPRISETEMKEEEADNEAIPAEKVTPFEELLVGRGITLDKVDYRLGGFPHLAHARRSGEVVVVKLTCRKEVEIHRLLSPAPNVVPLFDVIPTPTDSLLVITPLRVPLTIIHQNTAPLMLGLLDGVSFLHNSHIAHLDIRPQNLVVHKPDWRLEIIDFDLAVQASFDDLVEGFQGVEA
ncbi:hypothetical protein MPER_07768 [Moniliophthora perniciosa FA553]|nr:hypothetical protein MPER_07768 [Moniliophthora perniciosa FA553]